MIQPQNRRGNNHPIVNQRRRLLGLHRMLVVLNPPALLPHLNLPMHHLLVEAQVPLAREQPVLQVNPLHCRVLRARPHAHLVVRRQQRRGFVRRHGRHLVLMHLVQVDSVVLRAEQRFADGRELHGRVRELPAAAGRRFHAGAQRAAQDLVAEADAAEAHLGPRVPELREEVDELEDPGVGAVRVEHAAGDDDGADVLGDFVDGGHVAWVVAGFDDVVHVGFDAEGRVVSCAGLLEEVVEDVAEAAATFLGFGVGGVGFEDEHFDGVFGHCGSSVVFAALVSSSEGA